jgi:dihydropteroate synthase
MTESLIEAIHAAHRGERRPLVMGIVNVTPDSFSDGGRHDRPGAALDHALQLVAEGADLLDVGGESTRPGAEPVSEAEELERVIPVIERIRAETAVPISIDTVKPAVMHAAVAAGADMVNDVMGLRAEGALAAVAELGVPVCLMHMQGEPRTMQKAPTYVDVVADIESFFQQRLEACERAGIDTGRVVLDPGFGFGKTLAHNLALLARFSDLRKLGCPLLAGLSRKSMLGTLTGKTQPSDRVSASVAAALLAAERGAAIVRVHDVEPTVDALKVLEAVSGTAPVEL